MKSSSAWWSIPVSIAGALDVTMAMAHFGLQWEWHQVTDFGNLPPQLQWALFALNFSWGVLLLGIGALVLSAAASGYADPMARRLVLIVGAFWAVHGMYVALVPMPLPSYLLWLRAPLLAFPATVVVLHSTALAATISDRRVPAAAN
jgi:hypothetical protein